LFSVLALFSRVFSGETQPTVKIFVAAVARVTSGKYRYALSHKFLALENKTQKNPETRKKTTTQTSNVEVQTEPRTKSPSGDNYFEIQAKRSWKW